MLKNLYKKLLGTIAESDQLVRGNPAKNLIRRARATLSASEREFGFERISLDLAETAKDEELGESLRQIGQWHRHRAIEKLAEAVTFLRRAERCALSERFRRYAAMRLRKHETELKRLRRQTSPDVVADGFGSQGLAASLRSFTGIRAIIISLF